MQLKAASQVRLGEVGSGSRDGRASGCCVAAAEGGGTAIGGAACWLSLGGSACPLTGGAACPVAGSNIEPPGAAMGRAWRRKSGTSVPASTAASTNVPTSARRARRRLPPRDTQLNCSHAKLLCGVVRLLLVEGTASVAPPALRAGCRGGEAQANRPGASAARPLDPACMSARVTLLLGEGRESACMAAVWQSRCPFVLHRARVGPGRGRGAYGGRMRILPQDRALHSDPAGPQHLRPPERPVAPLRRQAATACAEGAPALQRGQQRANRHVDSERAARALARLTARPRSEWLRARRCPGASRLCGPP
jgi:hypothetical protein